MRGIWSMIVSKTSHPPLLSVPSQAASVTVTIGCLDVSLELDLIISSGHYEWHVAFPQPNIDWGAVRARIDEGILVIDVPR
jgi:hypothetical protein